MVGMQELVRHGTTLASTGGSAADGMPGGLFVLVLSVIGLFIFFAVVAFWLSRFKRCPSNRILVVFGKTGDQSARCYHGGGVMIWPVIQDYGYLSLEPLVIDIPLSGALSLNNIRVDVPATFTVGISTNPVLMSNAAERLLGLSENNQCWSCGSRVTV